MLITGITLGIGAAAPIGPVNVQIAQRALRAGFWAGFALGCGAVTVDVSYVALTSAGLAPFVTRRSVQWTLEIGGFLLLTYLAFLSFRAVPRHLKDDPLEKASVGSAHSAYGTGVLMTLLNPMTLIFWFVQVPAQGSFMQDPRHDLPMICAGVFIGTFGWVVIFAGLLAWLGQWRRNWWLAAADALGGAMLFFLAVLGLWHLSRRPL